MGLALADGTLETVAEPTSHAAERVLVVDDDPATRSGLTELVRAWGFTAESASDGAEALERVTDFRPSIIVSDMVMPRMSGLDLLNALKGDVEHIKVILLTAQGTVDTAVEAVKAGAEDYLTKPLDPHKLQRLLERLAEINRQKRENQALRRQLNERGRFGRIIGHSASMRALYHVLEQAAPTPASMLLLGESGTGKELAALAVHALSPRRNKPFVPVDCSGMTESLFESELFGHEKGAFTGASQRKAGLVETAAGGTLFLDELGDIPLSLQVKLLRLLEAGSFRRVGGTEALRADFRLVAATHRDLLAMVEAGTFRRDLYYRIAAFPIELPALRERKDDLPVLAEDILRRLSPDKLIKIASAAMTTLMAYDFPGNVRELRNILERAIILADSETIEPSHLPASRQNSIKTRTAEESIVSLDVAEKRYLQSALEQLRGDKSELAKRLGISRRTIDRKLQPS